MRKTIGLMIVLVIFALSTVLAAPDEASGIVTNVVDGDTFDLQIIDSDLRIENSIERIRLADVDSPEMSTPEGPLAKAFSSAILINKTVWLDIDDRSEDGRGPYDRLICVVYLAGLDGQFIPSPCFNRVLVDSGHAQVKDFTNNEFTPGDWWASQTVDEVSPEPATTTEAGKYVGSASSDKYHYPDCRWAKKIKPDNEIWFASSEEARAAGYVPCGTCKPP